MKKTGRVIKNKTVIVPILNREYKVVVCWGSREYVAKVVQRYGHDVFKYYDSIEHDRASTFKTWNRHPLIVLHKGLTRDSDDLASLAHEACHAVDDIFDYIGAGHDHELYAHSVGAIVRDVLNAK